MGPSVQTCAAYTAHTIMQSIKKNLKYGLKWFGVFGLDPTVWRQDFEGRLMKFDDYGNTSSLHGWQYDHITPKCIGGSDEIFNLRPRNLVWKSICWWLLK